MVSGTLTVVMGQRYQHTSKLYPAGVVAALSAGMSLFYVAKLVLKQKPHYKKRN